MGVFHLVRCVGLLLLLAGVGAQKKLLEKVLKKTTTLKPRLLQTSDGKDSYPRHFASCRICPFHASYLDCLIRSGWKVDQNNRFHYLHSHVSTGLFPPVCSKSAPGECQPSDSDN